MPLFHTRSRDAQKGIRASPKSRGTGGQGDARGSKVRQASLGASSGQPLGCLPLLTASLLSTMKSISHTSAGSEVSCCDSDPPQEFGGGQKEAVQP